MKLLPSITTGSPVLPDGWASWTAWQYSGTGTVAGINGAATDLDQASATFLGLLNPGTQDQAAGSPAGLRLQQAIPTPGQTVSYTATGLPPGMSLTASGLPSPIAIGMEPFPARAPNICHPGSSAYF